LQLANVWASAAPQPSDVTWSSVDDQLVFEAYRLKPDGSEDTENEGFHISNLDGTNLRRLTSGDDWRPDWSPNGQEILYEHYEDTTPYLRVIGADGRNQHDVPLPPEVQVFFAPKWSADGTHIIFSGQRELFGAEHAIYSVKPDGSDFHPILVAGETLGKDIGENFPLPRDVMFSDVDWCEVR
jgi:Tol biopolymer transport system component